MAMLFPGMDPYLEDHQPWTGVHASFMVYASDHLQSQLRPRYLAAVEERVYLEGPERDVIPDVWVRQNRPEAPMVATALVEADAPLSVQIPELEIHEAYVNILYSRPCQPPLPSEDQAWADERVRAARAS